MVTNYLRFSIYNNIHLHVYLICSLHLMQLSLSHSLMETTTISSSTPFLTLDHKIREPSGTVACPAALSTPSAKCGCHPPIPHPRGFLSLPHSHRHGLSPSSLAFVTRGASAEAERHEEIDGGDDAPLPGPCLLHPTLPETNGLPALPTQIRPPMNSLSPRPLGSGERRQSSSRPGAADDEARV